MRMRDLGHNLAQRWAAYRRTDNSADVQKDTEVRTDRKLMRVHFAPRTGNYCLTN